jgi:hypothetical protein
LTGSGNSTSSFVSAYVVGLSLPVVCTSDQQIDRVRIALEAASRSAEYFQAIHNWGFTKIIGIAGDELPPMQELKK